MTLDPKKKAAAMARLLKLDGAVAERRNIHSTVIGTKSPSLNFTFGKGWGLPFGYSLVMYGPPKGGKSVIANSMIAQLHSDYEDGWAIKFNTEMREEGQLTPQQAEMWGIDMSRYIGYDVNSPDLIFDRIEKEIAAECQDGLPVRLIIIDSLTGIQGRRSMNADSIMQQQIGDLALTLQEGLKRILPVQRKHGIALVVTAQVRAEMDQLEQKRGNKYKMAVALGVQHHCEYFMLVEMNRNKEGRTDLLGNELVNDELKDLMDKSERTGHKIRVCMKDSSLGPKGRVGEFTFDYDKGIINVHEEVFLLGINRGVIERPNNRTYVFDGREWNGMAAMVQALKEDFELQAKVIQELRRREVAGMFPEVPHAVEESA